MSSVIRGSVPVEREIAAMYPDAPPSGGACSWLQPEFSTMAAQYAAFDDDHDGGDHDGGDHDGGDHDGGDHDGGDQDGESAHDTARAAAKSICARCPIAGACADHALLACEEHGIWGGMTAAARAQRRRKDDELSFRARRAKAMHAAGVSTEEIAEALQVHASTVRRALRDSPPAA